MKYQQKSEQSKRCLAFLLGLIVLKLVENPFPI